MGRDRSSGSGRYKSTLAGLLAGILITFLVVGTLVAQESGTFVPRDRRLADLQGSSITVGQEQAELGSTLDYTITLSNSGKAPAANVVMTDSLPASLAYEDGSLLVSGQGRYGERKGVITWTGVLSNNAEVTISFSAVLMDSYSAGSSIQNSALITGAGSLITRTATTEIVSVSEVPETDLPETETPQTGSVETTLYLPSAAVAVVPPTLHPIGHPNSVNQWVVAWSGGAPDALNYELQVSNDPDFVDAATQYFGPETSTLITESLGLDNEFYYRVRLETESAATSDWSNVESVIGGYRDDFSDPSSGWAIRRTTFLEEVRSWYEEGWLIMQVEDSWDWGIASPEKVKGPSVPYAIEYRSKLANLGNLVSGGAVFGGDWPGDICPDYSTIEGVYEHSLCFNHFYNINTIWYGPLKMLFERVDYLLWCPNCGGSPMKRLSNDYSSWFLVDPVPNVDADNWNTWRIEVRANGIRLFANGQLFAQSNDTTWIHEPYFGVFASTDEYSNSTWRYDYYQVTALDN